MMLVSIAQRSARVAGIRALSTTAARRTDFVQDLYLRELKAYKAPAPVRAPLTSRPTHTRATSASLAPQPSAPAALSSSELAKELDSFAAAEPDAPAAAASPADETAAADKEDVNAYLAQLQADVKVEAHH